MFSENGTVKKSYYLHELGAPYDIAHQICGAFDMILAAPQNQDEYDHIKQLASVHSKADRLSVRIAVQRSEFNDQEWLSSGKKINYELTWADGEPDNIYNEQHCVGM